MLVGSVLAGLVMHFNEPTLEEVANITTEEIKADRETYEADDDDQ